MRKFFQKNFTVSKKNLNLITVCLDDIWDLVFAIVENRERGSFAVN